MQNRDRGHCHLLNSTCDVGDPPSRAPLQRQEDGNNDSLRSRGNVCDGGGRFKEVLASVIVHVYCKEIGVLYWRFGSHRMFSNYKRSKSL